MLKPLEEVEQSIDENIQSWDTRDIYFWCEELNLCVDELQKIINEVGPDIHNIRLYLAKNLLINWPVSY